MRCLGIYDKTRQVFGHRFALFLEEYGPTLLIGLVPIVLVMLWLGIARPHFIDDGGPTYNCPSTVLRYC